jgi:hypothetical protein
MALFAKHLGVIWAMDDARTHVGNSHFAHRPEEEEVKTDSIAREMSMHGDRPIRFFLAHIYGVHVKKVLVGPAGRQGQHDEVPHTATTRHDDDEACMHARARVCMPGHAGGHGAT